MSEEREFQMQVEGLAADVIALLVADKGYTLEQAMDVFYPSRTFRSLERAETGLYYQSPVYVYDCLLEEISSQR